MECGVVGHNFERDHLRTIPAKFGLIWFSSFRGEDLRFRLWCLKLLSTIFQLYHDGQLYWWGEPECSEKTYLWSFVTQIFRNGNYQVIVATVKLSK
jgi:hypothetical protein